MSHGAINTYSSAVRIFIEYNEVRKSSVLTVGKNELKGYIHYLANTRKVSLDTIESNFSAISSFYDFLVFEEYIDHSIIPEIRKRYIRRFKAPSNDANEIRKLISVEDMARLVQSITSARDRAIVMLLAKTGVRRGELIALDTGDVDLIQRSIRLKPAPKRTNRTVFFDDEAARALTNWLAVRKQYASKGEKALFVTKTGSRLDRNGVYEAVTFHAQRCGLHDSASEKLEDRFTPHCCRHWFTTHLRRSGMPREHIQELRGDVRKEGMDIYYHIDQEDLRKSYLAHIPKLNIE
jgi:integrase/recombinase XerD